MTKRELYALMKSYRATVCEWSNTAKREVFDNGWTFTDAVCIHHRRFYDAANSYIDALDRFLRDIRAEADSDAPCNSIVEDIVTRHYAATERQFRARPRLSRKPRPIGNQW